jgi:hypothetical protein
MCKKIPPDDGVLSERFNAQLSRVKASVIDRKH